MKSKVRTVLAVAACVSALMGVGAAGAKDSNVLSAKPLPSASSSAAHLKADRQLMAMLSSPLRHSFSPAKLNDDPDPSTCLSEGEACTPDSANTCCSTYCAPDDSGGGRCTGR